MELIVDGWLDWSFGFGFAAARRQGLRVQPAPAARSNQRRRDAATAANPFGISARADVGARRRELRSTSYQTPPTTTRSAGWCASAVTGSAQSATTLPAGNVLPPNL
jgi:hypothetical protein